MKLQNNCIKSALLTHTLKKKINTGGPLMKHITHAKTRRGIKTALKFVILVLVFVLFVLLFQIYQNIEIAMPSTQTNHDTYTAARTLYNTTNQNEASQSPATVDETIPNMIEETTKKVVGISKLKNAGTTLFTDTTEESLGIGSGIIVTSNGYILSNEHVTGSKYSKCYITLEDGQNHEGTVVWSDTDLDLSLTKIKAENLTPITLGNSDNIKIGETVYAIGNPIGFEFRRTVTSGIISAKDRTIKLEEQDKTSYMSNLIQTDATINPGNSGGPLIYPTGEMIGINTVKITSAEGIGFAVPINIVKKVIESFEQTDSFDEATLGIYAYDGTAVKYLEKSVTAERGIYVDQITPGGPASTTELKQGDIITKIDNTELSTVSDLRKYIFTKMPGDQVVLQISRGKITKQVSLTLARK